MTPTPQWYEADGDDADRHPDNAQEGTPDARMAVAGTPGPPDDCEALTGLLRLRTEALGRVQRERDELAAEVERAEAAWESWQDRCATAEAEVERLREWRKRILDEGFGYDDAEDSAAEVLEWAPTWMAQRIGAEYRLEAAEADNARLRETLARVRALCKNTDGEWLHTRLRRTACWRVHRRPVRARRGWCRVTPAEPTPEAVEALAIAMREADIARQIAKDPHGIASADTPRTAAADALAFLAKHPEYVPGLAWESRRWDVATRRETVRRRVVGPWQVVPDGD